ncbi:alpha-tocopherol transfer protein-like [Trichogramma pretiosum]|uniref:alpha-tocopherol transfer protein-like n=1 Tax=Trichogramma pretiosum TaxID=7493 RepID=UPI0006C96599|nr:alpha-tocopherol transfer protein-like [Trichogramma pretiosum]
MTALQSLPIEEEFERNPELKKEDLQYLRDWCSKQEHLPKISDNQLILFLHSNYFRLEACKISIENYYTCRTHVPEFFSNRDPIGSKEIRSAMNTLLVIPLEGKTKEGYHVTFGRLIDTDPERFIYNDGMRYWNMIADLWLHINGTSPGHVLVADITGVQMVHALKISPVGVKKYLYYLQEAMPVRIKGLHFLNTTPVMDFILGLMKPFMKKELMDVLYLHKNTESLAQHLPLDILPVEAGGKAAPMKECYSKVTKFVEENRNYFLDEENTMRVDESRRLGKAKSATDLFGIEGSFKKLDID